MVRIRPANFIVLTTSRPHFSSDMACFRPIEFVLASTSRKKIKFCLIDEEPPAKRSRFEVVLESTTRKLRFCLSHDDIPLPHALHALGLVGGTISSICTILDSHLPAAQTVMNKSRSIPGESERLHCVGIRGLWWHLQVVHQSLSHGPSYLKGLKRSPQSGGFPELLDPTKNFLIEGHLNASYLKRGPGRHTTEHFQISDDGDRENCRRHVMALRFGRIHSPGLPVNGIPLCNLWLDENGRPDQDKGFLKRILKVYLVVYKVVPNKRS